MAQGISHRRPKWPRPLAVAFAALALPIGAFALFVGFHKATAPMALLREVTAWTIHLPLIAGRTIGLIEMAAALALLSSIFVPRLAVAGAMGALVIAALNTIGGVVHYIHAETGTYAQTAVVVTLCILLTALAFAQVRRTAPGL